MLALVLTVLYLRVHVAVDWLCPCHRDPAPTCPVVHARAAGAIATVALTSRDPDEAAARLLGTAAHETCFRTERQRNGGPAVTWWQLEVVARDRAALLADPIAAARMALMRAQGCHGDLSAYAGLPCGSDAPVVLELRRYVMGARWALAASR